MILLNFACSFSLGCESPMASFFPSFGIAKSRRLVKNPMNSSKQTLRELESRRRALNERLMNSKTLADANNIERELWAVRAAIRHHMRVNASERCDVIEPDSCPYPAAM